MAERTLVIFKPDALQRRLVGRILARFEDKGLKIAALKLMQIPRELAERHYEPHKDKPFFGPLVAFMTKAPVIVLVLEGSRVVEVTRKMMGATFGYKAEPGTIRGDYGISNQFNLVHGSDAPESAEREIGLFVPEGGLVEYGMTDEAWLADE